jgi:thymidine phosphorylase
VVAILSNMDFPLGRESGNANEIAESIVVLRGGGPVDLRELTLRLGAEMLVLGGVARDIPSATARLEAELESGAALEKFRQIVAAQGGDVRVCDDPEGVLAAPAIREPYRAARDGVVQQVNALAVGHGITALGGGRQTMDDALDYAAGYSLRAIPGDRVRKGDVLAEILGGSAERVAAGRAALDRAIIIGDAPVTLPPLISHRVTAAGVERLA